MEILLRESIAAGLLFPESSQMSRTTGAGQHYVVIVIGSEVEILQEIVCQGILNVAAIQLQTQELCPLLAHNCRLDKVQHPNKPSGKASSTSTSPSSKQLVSLHSSTIRQLGPIDGDPRRTHAAGARLKDFHAQLAGWRHALQNRLVLPLSIHLRRPPDLKEKP